MAWGLARISGRELSEWMAYYRLEPWGEERADLRAGIVAATLAEIHRDPKKRAEPFEARDFMPTFRSELNSDAHEPPQQALSGQAWEEQLSMVEVLNQAFGGRDLRKKAGEKPGFEEKTRFREGL